MLKGRKIDVPGTFFDNVNPSALLRFDELIRTIDWSPGIFCNFPDDAYSKFISIFKNIYRERFLYKTYKGTKQLSMPGVTPDAVKIIKEKQNKLYNTFVRIRNPPDMRVLKKHRKKVTSTLR